MKDEYATLRAAFHAGFPIQAFTTGLDDGSTPYFELTRVGYWRSLPLDREPKFSCHFSRYRIKPEDAP